MNNKLTIEELEALKELLNKLDENNEVFKMSKIMVDINEMKLKKELDQKRGDNKK